MARDREDGLQRQCLAIHAIAKPRSWNVTAIAKSVKRLKQLEEERGIEVQHIRSRVKHPQTGGKVERLFGTIKSKLKARWPDGKKEFRSLDEIIR
jgi:transposase InsO family protein